MGLQRFQDFPVGTRGFQKSPVVSSGFLVFSSGVHRSLFISRSFQQSPTFFRGVPKFLVVPRDLLLFSSASRRFQGSQKVLSGLQGSPGAFFCFLAVFRSFQWASGDFQKSPVVSSDL